MPRLWATMPSADAPPATRRDVTGKVRVLVVDDEDAIVAILRRILPRRGYEARCLISSVEALDVFRRDPDAFDVVVTDRTMPQLTGDALVASVHALRPRMPVVIASGQGHAAHDGGSVPWIVQLAKPFDAAELVNAIERARGHSECTPGPVQCTLLK